MRIDLPDALIPPPHQMVTMPTAVASTDVPEMKEIKHKETTKHTYVG